MIASKQVLAVAVAGLNFNLTGANGQSPMEQMMQEAMKNPQELMKQLMKNPEFMGEMQNFVVNKMNPEGVVPMASAAVSGAASGAINTASTMTKPLADTVKTHMNAVSQPLKKVVGEKFMEKAKEGATTAVGIPVSLWVFWVTVKSFLGTILAIVLSPLNLSMWVVGWIIFIGFAFVANHLGLLAPLHKGLGWVSRKIHTQFASQITAFQDFTGLGFPTYGDE